MEKSKRQSEAKPLLIVAISFFSFVAIGMYPGVLTIAWTYMQDTFAISGNSLGALLGAYTVGRLVIAFASGQVVERLGLAKSLLLACIIASVAAVGYAIVPSFTVLLIVAFVAALGTGIIDSAVNSFASVYYGKGQMNWLHASFGVGLAISPAIVTVLVEQLGQSWRVSYGVLAGVFVVLGILFLLTLPHWQMPRVQPLNVQDGATEPESIATVWETLFFPGVILGLVFFAFYGTAEIGTGQLMNTLLVEGRGFEQELASSWVSFYLGTFTVGRIVIGFVGERISNLMLIRLSLGGNLLGTLLLWLDVSPELTFLGLALIGFGLAPLFAVFIGETPERVGPRHTANAIGFQIGFAGLGGAVLSGIGGSLAESFGAETVALFLLANAGIVFILYEVMRLRGEQRLRVAKLKAD